MDEALRQDWAYWAMHPLKGADQGGFTPGMFDQIDDSWAKALKLKK